MRSRQQAPIALPIMLLIIWAALGNGAAAVQEQPAALALAVLAPVDCDWQTSECVAVDANVEIYRSGRSRFLPVTNENRDHASVPAWRPNVPATPDFMIPTAPDIQWPVDGIFGPVARGERGIRYCPTPAERWDARNPGYNAADEMARALADKFADFWTKPPERDCTTPDVYFGPGAEDTGEHDDGWGCGAGAWGCARVVPASGRYIVWLTFAGEKLRTGQMPRTGAVYWIHVHESGHLAGAGHTGAYDPNEGRPHPHRSDQGYICILAGSVRPCDNTTGVPACEDLIQVSGHEIRFNLKLKVECLGLRPVPDPFNPQPTPRPTARPTPQPTPTPTPTPTPQPTASPSPAPGTGRIYHQRWSHNDPACTEPLRPDGWCIEPVSADGSHRAFGPGGGWLIDIWTDGRTVDYNRYGGWRYYER